MNYKVGDKLLHIAAPNDKVILIVTDKWIAEEDEDSIDSPYTYVLNGCIQVGECWLNSRCIKLSELGEILYG